MLARASAEELRPLREVCRQADYTEHGLLEMFGPVQLPGRLGREAAHFLYLTREGRALDTLVRLFLLGVAVPRRAAAAALGEDLLEACGRWGLLERCGEAVAGLVRLLPYKGLLLATDQAERPEIARRSDQVMGITASTAALADFTLRRPVEDALDLGTGCGVQALLAAAHARRVAATDCNPRALEFARWNAQLNNRANICFIQADAFGPLGRQRFDLAVVNPPFAVSPSRRFLYRDSGERADQFCRRLVREAPERLKEGGFFQMTLDWVERAGQDWTERLASWFEGTGCDAWVLRLGRELPAHYAYLWIRDTEPGGPEEAGRLYQEWMEYFGREQIEAVSTGLIAMRRRSGRAHWLRIEEAPEGIAGPVGEWVARGFLLKDFLEETGEEALLAARLRLAPEVRLEQESEAREGRWQAVGTRIRLTGGLPWGGNLDPRLAASLARLNGRRPLRDVLVHLAVELGVERERLIGQCLPLVRDMILRGFLLPEGIPAAGEGPEGTGSEAGGV